MNRSNQEMKRMNCIDEKNAGEIFFNAKKIFKTLKT